MELKQKIEALLQREFKVKNIILERPRGHFGDFTLTPAILRMISQKVNSPCDKVALSMAKMLTNQDDLQINEAKFEGGYLNLYLKKEAYLKEEKEIFSDPARYFIKVENQNQTIVFDYSSPNIAKPFSIGHMRSTNIGQANYNLYRHLGYKTIGINYLGDWGTQFGKLIYAILTWGNEKKIAANPMAELVALYQKFHQEAETDESLNEKGRKWFEKLEKGDAQAKEIWQKCMVWSKKNFAEIYRMLHVKIDVTTGESNYVKKAQNVISELKRKRLLEESQGAKIVKLGKITPAIIVKSNETTTYITRDLAALRDRITKYKPSRIIYHVGNDQALHFKQLELVAEKLGWLKDIELIFAGHGLLRMADGKISTRAGRTIMLEDLIKEANRRSLKIIEKKNHTLKNKSVVAQKIAISAIKYADLSYNRKSDLIFSFDKIISLQGNSGPYMQYTYARLCSLERKYAELNYQAEIRPYLSSGTEALGKLIFESKQRIAEAAQSSYPNLVCDYLFELSNEFNRFYEKKRIITQNQPESAQNMFTIKVVKNLMGILFDILGLDKLSEI